jgi:hypothetical protein
MKETVTRPPETTGTGTPLTLLLFSTNISSDEDFTRASAFFDSHPHIHEWNIDRDDVDCVLRIFTGQLTPGDVIALAGKLGFVCSELE